jgi:DNA-binding transcriptional LysR family regulator
MRKQVYSTLHGLDVRTLRLFDSVVAFKSLTLAAKANHLAIGAASRRIKKFEDLIGAPLLTRHHRGLTLTRVGATVADSVREILDQFNALGSISNNLRVGITKHVRLLANGVAITQYLPATLRKFREKNPDVMVEVEEARSLNIANALIQGQVNIGVTSNLDDAPQLGRIEYPREPLVLVAPRNHSLSRRHRVRFTDTLDYDYIVLPVDSLIYKLMSNEARKVAKKIRVLAQVSGLYHACCMVSAGLGLAVVPLSTAYSLRDMFDLAIVNLEGKQFSFRQSVIHIEESKLTPIEKALLDHFRNCQSVLAGPESIRRNAA